MPKLSGLFDSFDNLDQISVENIAYWLKSAPNLIQLENYLANKILYPQTLPMSEPDMKIDLAILREALRINVPKTRQGENNSLLGENPFLNITLRKILIPQRFLNYVPDIITLAWAFVDALLLNRKREDFFSDLWTVVVTDDADEIVGSVLLPQFTEESGVMELNLSGKTYKIHPGSLTVIKCPKDRCEIAYKFNQGKILGKEENAVEIYGGKLGLMIDGRK